VLPELMQTGPKKKKKYKIIFLHILCECEGRISNEGVRYEGAVGYI
jgi:hypothetical protein